MVAAAVALPLRRHKLETAIDIFSSLYYFVRNRVYFRASRRLIYVVITLSKLTFLDAYRRDINQ